MHRNMRRDSTASGSSMAHIQPSRSRRAASKREKLLSQLLRQPDAHPVTMNIQVEVEVPAVPGDLDLGSSNPHGDSPDIPSERQSIRPSHAGDKTGRFSLAPSAHANAHKNMRATATSSYVHYEFVAPHDDTETKSDLVVHHNGAKAFVDSDARSAAFAKCGEMLRASWTHRIDTVMNTQLIQQLYDHGLHFKIWDTKDKVASRARFDRPKGGHGIHLSSRGQDHPEASGGFDNEPSISQSILQGLKPAPKNTASADGSGACLSVFLDTLFSGDLSFETTLRDIDATGLKRLISFKVRVSVDRPLLSPEQMVIMNPLTLTIHSAEGLPNSPVSFYDLDKVCKPVSLLFKFFGSTRTQRWEAEGPHNSSVFWDRSCVILTGLLDRSDFAYWLLHAGGLEVQVHDRDRRTDVLQQMTLEKAAQSIAQQEDFSDYNVVGRKLATSENDVLWDPYGVAKVDLSPLVRGVRRVKLSVPILPCSERECPMFTMQGQEVGGSMHPGHYVSAGSFLEVTAELAHGRRFDVDVDVDYLLVRSGVVTEQDIRKRRAKRPGSHVSIISEASRPTSAALNPAPNTNTGQTSNPQRRTQIKLPDSRPSSAKLSSASVTSLPSANKRPFGCIILKMTSSHGGWAVNLRSHVVRHNTKVLGFTGDKIVTQLERHRLDDVQLKDASLDVITGVEITIPGHHVVILEGVAESAFATFVSDLRWPQTASVDSFQTLYNSSVHLPSRMYGKFGCHVPKIVLNSPIETILQQQELYFQGHPMHACLSGLCGIQDILRTTRISEVLRHNYFPTFDSLSSIIRELASSETNSAFQLSQRLKEMRSSMSKPPSRQTLGRSGMSASGRGMCTLKSVSPPHKAPEQVDFINRNRENVKKTSEENAKVKAENSVLQFVGHAEPQHMYSSQRFNKSTESLKQMRTFLDSTYGKHATFTYNDTFHHSGALELADEKEEAAQDEAFKATKWRTASGFDTTKRNVVDISRPASQAADSEEFGESLVNRANLTFDRNPLPWKERQLDMNTSSSADILGPRHVPSMDTTGREAELAFLKQEQMHARSKMLGNEKFLVHHPPKKQASLDKHVPLLKDRPVSRSLRRSSLKLPSSLSSSLDFPYEEESSGAMTFAQDKGFARTSFVSL